jgi:hypothetical protein
MMKLKVRDLIATVLVAAIAVPYIGYLIRGEMPFVQDPRGMAGVGLVLGATAYLVLGAGERFDAVGKTELTLGIVSLALGVAALAFAETAFAGVLLAVFMGSILVVYLAEMVDHAGFIHIGGHGMTHA